MTIVPFSVVVAVLHTKLLLRRRAQLGTLQVLSRDSKGLRLMKGAAGSRHLFERLLKRTLCRGAYSVV